eukprot:COSAG06_NODE_3648_length_5072_cov_2.519204_2_plen_317_part_00
MDNQQAEQPEPNVIQRMVSAEREAKQQAEAETYWELQRAKSMTTQLASLRESLQDEEAYWALRRQQSFGEALRREWSAGSIGAVEESSDFEDETALASTALHPGGLAPLPPPPPASQQAALAQVQQEIVQLSVELDVSSASVPAQALHPGGLAPLPPPPTTTAPPQAPAEIAESHAYRTREYQRQAREQQVTEAYWAQESALRRQRSLSELAQKEEEEELSRGGGPLDWSIPSFLHSEVLSTDVTGVATEYLQAGRRAAKEALSVGQTVAKAALDVSHDVRSDVTGVVAKVSEHVNDVFTAPEPLGDEDAYWQGKR